MTEHLADTNVGNIEYISRHAAIEALGEQIALCDKALKSFGISMKDEYAVKVEKASLVAYKEQLEALPSADVVQVVRCKDCKYWDDTEAEPLCEVLHDGDGVMYSPEPDDFCSYGERKE